MGKKELVKIDIYKGEEPGSKIYVLSMNIKDFSIYERAKAITRFVDKETKVLEMAIENDLREFIKSKGIKVYDGSISALNRAFYDLENQGITFDIIDRYKALESEHVIGESENQMTIIEEDGVLSCAMEVIIDG